MSLEPGDEFGLDDVVGGSTALVMLLACKIARGISEERRNCVQIAEFCLMQAFHYNLQSCTCVKLTQIRNFPIRNGMF